MNAFNIDIHKKFGVTKFTHTVVSQTHQGTTGFKSHKNKIAKCKPRLGAISMDKNVVSSAVWL